MRSKCLADVDEGVGDGSDHDGWCYFTSQACEETNCHIRNLEGE